LLLVDWACGGQWNRMMQFLAIFIEASEAAGLELAVFFNGSLETPRQLEWINNQLDAQLKVNNVSNYITFNYNRRAALLSISNKIHILSGIKTHSE
jgi:hypothetical protein